MDWNHPEIKEIDQRLTAVLGAEYWLQRANQIRESKVTTTEFVLADSLAGTLGAVATYACSGELLHMANNGLKELRARVHERQAYKILKD